MKERKRRLSKHMKPRWTCARGLPVHEKGAGNMKGMSVPTSQEAKISCDILRRSFATSWPSRIGRSKIQHVELELVWGAGERGGEGRSLLLLRSLRVVVVAVSCSAIALLLAADSAPPSPKVQVSRTRRLILLLCSKSHVFLWCVSSVMMLYSRRFYYVVRRRHVRCIGNGLLLPCLHSSSFFSVSFGRPFLVFVTAFLLIFCFEFPSVSACVLGFSFVLFCFCFFLGISLLHFDLILSVLSLLFRLSYTSVYSCFLRYGNISIENFQPCIPFFL